MDIANGYTLILTTHYLLLYINFTALFSNFTAHYLLILLHTMFYYSSPTAHMTPATGTRILFTTGTRYFYCRCTSL
jgi:hypothetical protein